MQTQYGLTSTFTYEQACEAIAKEVQQRNDLSAKAILKIIRRISSRYYLNKLPKNEDIIKYLSDESHYRNLLKIRPTKSASGVIVVAVMPKPFGCPHGRCIYCPGGIEYNTPPSYIGSEPVTKIAQKFNYDPYNQIQSKINQLYSKGHSLGKVEVVIVGGTFPFMPLDYQKEFVKSCFDALNGSRSSSNLQEAINANENASIRCVGLTVETKPDYAKRQHIDLMLELGVTRIEIGVQTLREEIYHVINRGHSLDDVRQSFQIAKDSGYKIVAHMMPGLPNSSVEKDIEDFRTLFEDPAYRPDMLKIYPTLVIQGTALHKLHQDGRYQAYCDDDLIDVLIAVKKMVPPWVRIMRIQREIEYKDIIAGPKSGNLRQILLEKLKERGLKCRCIRCREVGLQRRDLLDTEIKMNRIDYYASKGHEVFLAFESLDKSIILGFLRLRKILNPHRNELKGEDNSDTAAIVRELHVYGQMLNVGNKKQQKDISYQHQGYGFRLMQEAERIAKDEFKVKKLSVISAVGTREYYKRMGYALNGPYVSKVL
ncbi:MAG: tRNA uridine(34) 5-carboxymethylaminomethyl modification radical SAM/GNAT enzyme Elp3 [Thermoproteota archaeon]|nr:tRNA uridine(34) 5-carboxymethylaminomethyl modification radical SAM/GNAT enzyme Elp3 [Thermoproteota archaeon]